MAPPDADDHVMDSPAGGIASTDLKVLAELDHLEAMLNRATTALWSLRRQLFPNDPAPF